MRPPEKAHGVHGPRYVEGFLSTTPKGFGFVRAEEFGEDILIETGLLNTGLNGDRVKVLLHPRLPGKRQSGEVAAILVRARTEFVGILECEDDAYFVAPQGARMYTYIVIPFSKCGSAKPGEKVLVEMEPWTNPRKNPVGHVLEVIGMPGRNDTEMRAILAEKGFKPAFPEKVENESRFLKKSAALLLKHEEGKRRDFRGVPTCTIDPANAKDFDDALSIQERADGTFEVGVHIADPTFYIHEGGAIDEEAARRGTSVYLVDRTIPMLPEVLSNDICSLNPDEDKLTFSCVLILDRRATVLETWIGRTIIRSVKRFSYEEAQGILDEGRGAFYAELRDLDMLSRKMSEQRHAQGAISFEHDEVRFELDANGVPLRIYKKERLQTMKLIEQFMILANQKVTEFASGKDKNIERTFVYRVHDVPDEERVKELLALMKMLGYKVSTSMKIRSPHEITKLLKQVEGTAHETMIQLAAIQSMAKAVYSTKNIGHFGLSLKHYTHFTSPIRRYPDMMVHRLLSVYLEDKLPKPHELESYEALSRYATEMEIAAADAERASIKYKQVEYMSVHIGETFTGVITGLTERGIFVEETETKTDGMIHLRDIKDDFYQLDEKTFSIVGSKTKKKYALGDTVTIKVVSTDQLRRLVDYALVS